MTRTTHEIREELARRSNDGLDVALLWARRTNRVAVSVLDAKTGDAFELPVLEGENPLHVFDHPFAYAARRGVAVDTAYAEAA